MAKVYSHGKNAIAQWNGSDFVACTGWEINLTCQAAESSVMGTEYKLKVAGYKGSTASVTCLVDTNNPARPPFVGGTTMSSAQEATLKLERLNGTAGAGYYSGTAICIGGTDSKTDGVDTQTYNFIFTGAVTFATS